LATMMRVAYWRASWASVRIWCRFRQWSPIGSAPHLRRSRKIVSRMVWRWRKRGERRPRKFWLGSAGRGGGELFR